MPRVRELAGRNYYVNVTSPDGELTYMGRRQLYFSSDDFGFLFVKTDKPIYKPEQDGESSVEGVCICLFLGPPSRNHSLTHSHSHSHSLSLLVFVYFAYHLPLLLPHSFPLISSSIIIVKFCLAFLDKTLKPHKDHNEVSYF